MKTQLPNTTRYASQCRKAAVVGLAMLLAYLLATFTPAHAQVPEPELPVVGMVKGMPFPYAQGFAMKDSYLEQIKKQLIAADTLRARSERAIKALKKEIQSAVAYQRQLDSLQRYDKNKADSLSTEIGIREGMLENAQDSLAAANRATERIMATVPRPIRKALRNATPDQQATAITDYVATLRKRKFYYFGAGSGLGLLLSIIAAAVR